MVNADAIRNQFFNKTTLQRKKFFQIFFTMRNFRKHAANLLDAMGNGKRFIHRNTNDKREGKRWNKVLWNRYQGNKTIKTILIKFHEWIFCRMIDSNCSKKKWVKQFLKWMKLNANNPSSYGNLFLSKKCDSTHFNWATLFSYWKAANSFGERIFESWFN